MKATCKLSVLVVDDEADFVETVTKRLRRRGVDCEGVLSGSDALEAIKSRHFDVMLLDVRLADMDGNDVLLEIRRIRPETRVVMLSGYASAYAGRRGMSCGALDYLIKPVEFESLYEKVTSTGGIE